VLSLTELSVHKYFVQLKDDLFAAGTTTADKVFNTFSDALYIRLAWINEMKDKKCDSSVL
jgi:predicted small integral membrane protein